MLETPKSVGKCGCDIATHGLMAGFPTANHGLPEAEATQLPALFSKDRTRPLIWAAGLCHINILET